MIINFKKLTHIILCYLSLSKAFFKQTLEKKILKDKKLIFFNIKINYSQNIKTIVEKYYYVSKIQNYYFKNIKNY